MGWFIAIVDIIQALPQLFSLVQSIRGSINNGTVPPPVVPAGVPVPVAPSSVPAVVAQIHQNFKAAVVKK